MNTSARLPLSGSTVIDSTDERGELCSRLLADLGADVIRTEPPSGSASRRLPPLAPDGTSLWFAVRNANKRCVTLDVADTRDHARLHDFLRTADVWITSRVDDGLTAASIAEIHPHLVMVTVSDFGLTGPYRDYAATDDVLVAMSGMLCRSGEPSRPPLLPPGSLAHDAGSVSAAFATLAALWQRGRSGRGQHLDVSLMHAVAQITDWALPNWSAMAAAGGSYPHTRAGSGSVYPLFPCADGYVRLIILTTRQWRAMRAWLGEPEFLQDDHWDHIINRISIQGDILDPLYIEFFSTRTAAELAAEAQSRGIVMTPVLKPSEVLTTPHFVERGTFAAAEIAPGMRGSVQTGMFEIAPGGTGAPHHAGFRFRAPMVGEHDATVVVASTPPASTFPAGNGDAPTAAPSLPFTGLKVLDFGHGGVGVEAGRLLAEYGADVIKVESWTYPDFMRGVQGGTMSASFASSSRLKRSLSVNVKDPQGRAVVEQLVRWADVVIENNSTGTMDDMGLGYRQLRALNPSVVMVSSQLMGSTGPWKDWIGYGPSTRPIGGMTHLWNFPGGGMPPGSGAVHPDHLAGRVVALAAAAGLIGRGVDTDGRGEGTHLEVAQVDVVLSLLADLYLQESITPGSAQPDGNGSPRDAPWGVYPCTGDDRWCVITVRDDADFAGLRAVLGDPEWARAPELATREGRLAARAGLDDRLAEWTLTRSDRDVMSAMQAAGVPAGYMVRPGDMTSDPQYVERGFPQSVDQPELGPLIMEGPYFTATGMPAPLIGPAALLGRHTREICREVLGMSDDSIDALIESGAVREAAGSPASAAGPAGR